jgi:hypothetical protein
MVEPQTVNDDNYQQDSSDRSEEAERASDKGSSKGDEDQFHDCHEVPVLQSMEVSMETKAEAAKMFKEGDLTGAINKYTLALSQAPEIEVKHRAILNFNIGMCLVKSQGPKLPAAANES